MSGMSSGGIRVGRLVTRDAGLDALATRLRLEATLGMADLGRAGLPPDAILCVRRLSDPAPGKLPLRRSGVAPADWLMAVERRLERLAREAARPALGPVADSVEAVLFADRAELLAALAAAWATSGALDRWWWRRMLPTIAPREAVVAAWCEAAASAPAALEQLAGSSALAPFLDLMGDGGVSRVTVALLRAWGLPSLATVPAADGAGTTVAMPNLPWAAVAPEIGRLPLPPRAALLGGIGLTLARRPAVARRAGFAAACEEWLRSATERDVPAARAPGNAVTRDAGETEGPHVQDPGLPESVRPKPGEPPSHPPSRPDRPPPSRPESKVSTENPDRIGSSGEARPAAGVAGGPAPLGGSARPEPDDGRVLDPPSPDAPVPGRAAAEVAAGLPTEPWPPLAPRRLLISRHAGMLFLANVALALELYPDFSRPADPGLPIEFWAFMIGLATRLLGEEPDDPLWPALRALAGAEDDRPPPEPDDWRIPPAWRAPGATRQGWDAWWAAAVPFIRDRLDRALNLPDGEDAAALLIRQPARVELGTTTIHAVFALERHPIEIRLVGLDRDPGWIPAAGRSITFGFDLATA